MTGAPKTCLIVDDSRVVRKLARLMLENAGLDCAEAESGEQALELCRPVLPGAILLDWNMPGMSGIDFLRLLRALPGGAAVKVILCTIYNEKAHIEEALAAGADEYIMKPFDNDIILFKFEEAGAL
jgi:two-component system, chemotaxis family, chemotaxis protein CheY